MGTKTLTNNNAVTSAQRCGPSFLSPTGDGLPPAPVRRLSTSLPTGDGHAQPASPFTCPRCKTNALVKGQCLACGATLNNLEPIRRKERQTRDKSIINHFERYGCYKTAKAFGMSTRTLYLIPEVRIIMLRKVLDKFPREEALPVIAEYLKSGGK